MKTFSYKGVDVPCTVAPGSTDNQSWCASLFEVMAEEAKTCDVLWTNVFTLDPVNFSHYHIYAICIIFSAMITLNTVNQQRLEEAEDINTAITDAAELLSFLKQEIESPTPSTTDQIVIT